MTINFRKLTDKAIQPIRTTTSGAGYELTSVGITTETNERGQIVLVYHTGIAIDVPEGYEATLRPVDTLAAKTLRMCDAPAVVVPGTEIVAKFVVTTDVVPAIYKDGDRVVQLSINKVDAVDFVEVKDEQSAPTGSQSPSEDKDMSINSETATEGSGREENIPEQAQ